MKKLLILGSILFSVLMVRAQSACTTLGQTPVTAFPVCGSSIFTQSSVPACVNGKVTAPCASGTGNTYQDLNPYWYKFTCFVSGSLGFEIDPNNSKDDYDWQLFDVTNHDPSEVYTNPQLVVGCNWSGRTGNTGTSSGAASLTECGSLSGPGTNINPPIFSKMPDLIQGHNYLLLISHFSGDSQSGYSLSFAGHGGTASITDSIPPALKSIQPICDGRRIQVVLNKRMKCNSLALDGSDFSLTPSVPGVKIVEASGNSCSSGFDLDTILLVLNGPLPLNTYTLSAFDGADGNTLLDNCGTQIPQGSSMSFTQTAPQPTPFDSLTPPACAPGSLQLVFKKKILCSSIAANGTDFRVTGPSTVVVSGAAGECDANGETYTIRVQLAAPIVTGGDYLITLAPGIDGNTIIDECGLSTGSGVSLPFTLKDTVSAVFNDQILYGCSKDTVLFNYPGKNGVDQWKWYFAEGDSSSLQNPPKHIYSIVNDTVPGDIIVNTRLIVSNGFCSDTASVALSLQHAINAAFEAPNILCPTDAAIFKNNSIGPVGSFTWDFGDGTRSSEQLPPGHLFPVTGIETKYGVRLIVQDNSGCHDTAVRQIDVLRSCYIAVPSAFTPNGDGLNDYLYPLNAFKADNLEFRVFNRYGQLVFESRDYTRKWDGRIDGNPQPAGTFVWMLQYTDRDSGKKFFQKGTSILIR